MIRLAIPAVTLLIAVVLIRKKPTAYIALAMWSWFLSPLVRRLVDWKLGWQEPNFILLTPLLVSSVAVLPLLAPGRRRRQPLPVALLLCGAAVLYGFLMGVLQHPSSEVVYGLFNWLAPILLAAFIAKDYKNFHANRATILNSFVWGAAVMGSYGVYQFFVAPPWDAYWLQNISSGLIDPSFGDPEPLKMRVWSTMNAPGPFSGAMISVLLFLLISKSKIKIPASIVGYVSFLLTVVRAAWLGLLVGLVVLLRKAGPRLLFRTVATLLLLVAILVPVIQRSAVLMPIIGDRFKSLSELHGDESLRERQDMYRVVTGDILNNPFGDGLKNQEIVSNLVVDSGVLTMLLSLGWLGTLLYVAGVLLLIATMRVLPEDPFVFACQGVIISGLAQSVGANLFVSSAGAFFWLSAGSLIAANLHMRHNPGVLMETRETNEFTPQPAWAGNP